MNFEEALKAELSSITGLTNKIFALNAVEGTAAPYVVYVSSYGLEDETLEGYDVDKEVPCELNIIHNTYPLLKTLIPLVIAKIKTFQSRVIGTDGPYIQDVTYEEPVELYEHEIEKYRSVISIKVKF